MEGYTHFEQGLIENGVPFCVGERLSCHTAVALGGGADFFITPKRVIDLVKAMELAKQNGVKSFMLGNGSNTLVSDAGFRGAVICPKDICEIYVERISGDDVFVRAFCGASLTALVGFCVANRLTGLEFLRGIPGTVGGALYMNAGFCSKSISDVTLSAFTLTGGKMILLSKQDCCFSYRASIFQKVGSVIISALFHTKKASFTEINAKLNAYKAMRKGQPKGKSLGSVFKNGDIPSGKAIDACGLKNARVGGAYVSPEHANFIINDGTASSADVYDLIKTIKAVVKENTGLSLYEEIKYLGEFR